MTKPSPEKVKQLLAYDPETGVLTWSVRVGSRAIPGNVAGRITHSGYRMIKINGIGYGAHRLAWVIFHGEWPHHFIDHINGIKADNRIVNLRDVPQSINMQNIRNSSKGSSSGVLGVHSRFGKWIAQIRIANKVRYLGIFPTAEEAHLSYLEAKRKYHEGCTI